MFRCHNHAGLIAGALVAASLTLAATASSAMPRYDGLWSVSIVTKKGDCIASYRYPLRIANSVLANGGDIAIDVRGKVAADGAVTVIVSHGDTRAAGFGRLAANAGNGSWRPALARAHGPPNGVRRANDKHPVIPETPVSCPALCRASTSQRFA
jgi:hypothetical protein